MIDNIIKLLKSRQGEKRFNHTLGVRDMAVRLGRIYLPDELYPLECAALLHDITKECTKDENIALMGDIWQELSSEEKASAQILHAYSAPMLIKKEFPSLATEKILSSIMKHTVGDENMSTFDMIIFISDFIEVGRKYPASVKTREYLFNSIEDEKTDNLYALINACIMEIDYTIEHIKEKNGIIVPKTLLARKALLEKIR